MIYYIDIDDTICNYTDKTLDYNKALPILENIERVNNLYDEGHTIVYWTSRGTGTGINWETVTTNQLKEWGAKYHKIVFNKPIFDIYICDKVINIKDW